MSHLYRSAPERPTRSWRRPSGTVQWVTTIMLGLTWTLVWGRYDLPTLLMGLVFGVVVSLAFPLPPLRFSGTVRPLWWFALTGRLIFDLVWASVKVAWAAVVRGPRVRNAILRVPLRTRSDFVMTQVAELTTLVPGSVALETRRAIPKDDEHEERSESAAESGEQEFVGTNILYVHVMDLGEQPDIEAEREKIRNLEARVIRAFGPRSEYDLLRKERGGDE
ncbi:MAG TPA: Na+/H+ antiporter subunit E [Candidatus Avipropionibacterium avicola]|uniref:Na+/H+ antiporter subunit E n=1 Tax=Candidatus Avipropionibacterium avicola TaxID=2840701 RepID=A0A9D1H1A5_9ACTN|nr:Na+/H+ antiporter subunit E [Candidatus Avipropionibacterium avicola]